MGEAVLAGVAESAWVDACRRMTAAQRELFAATPGLVERTDYVGLGEGGDRTLRIDRDAEDIVFAELARLHEEGGAFTAISEERGEVVFGDGSSPWRIVIDPIDGSLNARRTIPAFALSLAIAAGPTMAEVEFGFVHDFGPSEEYVARRGHGARLDGRELRAEGPGYGLELVGLEATKPELIVPVLEGLRGKAFRIRGIGALAIALCYVAAGRLDGMLGVRPCRSVDVAAAQLIVREAGASVELIGRPLRAAELDLDARYEIAAGLDPEVLETLLAVRREAAARAG